MALRVKRLELTGDRAIQSFRTIALNEAELESTAVQRMLVTDLEELQRTILKAAGVCEKRMQEGWRRLE